MPYLRLYSPEVPLTQKRVIAQRLIEITVHAFDLSAEDRHRINIQFIPLPRLCGVSGLEPEIPEGADFFLEVNDHGLTAEKKRAFAEEAKPMLTEALAAKSRSRLARLLGLKADISRQIVLQFNELLPDEWSSEQLLGELERWAA